jgi:hypothetical protein
VLVQHISGGGIETALNVNDPPPLKPNRRCDGFVSAHPSNTLQGGGTETVLDVTAPPRPSFRRRDAVASGASDSFPEGLDEFEL